MMRKKRPSDKSQIEITSLDELVPRGHLVRKLERALDLSFIYDMVRHLYSDFGRESIDPVVLVKLNIIQYVFGIRSMRQTLKEIEVNVAYRWYIGYGLHEKLPHFSTFSKNYTRRFMDTDIFERIFFRILEEIHRHGFIDDENLFIDGTHIKASANNHKSRKEVVEKSARYYEDELRREINADREQHGKKPIAFEDSPGDDKDDDAPNDGAVPSESKEQKTIKVSTTDPDCGVFHKGEHKKVFAYTANVACDRNNYVLDFEAAPGNMHDSTVFPSLFERLCRQWREAKNIVVDAGYKTPAIAKEIILSCIYDAFVQMPFGY